MDSQLLLEREAAVKGLTLTPLSHVAALSTSQKVACCGGFLERVVAESAQDCTVVLRDATGTVHCAIHGGVSSRYPDVLAAGALLLLRDVTLLVTSNLMPPVLIVCLEHLAALMLPEKPLEGGGQTSTVDDATFTFPFVDLPHQGREARHGTLDEVMSVRPHEMSIGSPAPAAASTRLADPTIPCTIGDDGDADEDCLQLADDL